MEYSRMMRSMFNKVVLIITDGLTKELAIGLYLFGRSVIRLVRKSGYLFTARKIYPIKNLNSNYTKIFPFYG